MHIPGPSTLIVAILPKVKIQRIAQRPLNLAFCVIHF